MIPFDVICPTDGSDLSAFVDAAGKNKMKALGILSPTEKMLFCISDLSVPDEQSCEPVLCLFHFSWENRVWDLSCKDDFLSLVARFDGDVDRFLIAYRNACKSAILGTDCRLAFGLESFRDFLDGKSESSTYRKTILDLTDLLVKRGQAVGYAAKHPVFDLSPCVLRRIAELRGDLLPATFAQTPSEIGKGLENTLLSARAAGIGSYLTYVNSGWERRPITTYKENL